MKILKDDFRAVATRREALKMFGVGAMLPSRKVLAAAIPPDLDRTIVLRDPGGVFRKAWQEAFYDPFEKETGIKVIPITSAAEPTAQIIMMVESRNYLWDMAGALTEQALNMLVKHDAIEPHGLLEDPCLSGIPKVFYTAHSIASDIYSTVMAVDKSAFSQGILPVTWSDFWDRRRFPQWRSLRKDPSDTLEAALLADGVKPADLYPLDLNRAFASLEKIRPAVAAWWGSAAQARNLLESGEVDMLATWSNRINHENQNLSISWEQNMWGVDSWAILKGTPKADMCRTFLKYVCDPKRQAVWTKWLRNGPPNTDAYRYISPQTASMLPTYPLYLEKGFHADALYWTANRDTVLEHFNEWLLQ